LLLLVGLTLRRLLAPDVPPLIELHGSTMGTTWSAKVVTTGSARSSGAPDPEQLHGAIEERLALVNSLMSTYDPESELSRFNRSGSTQPFDLSANTIEVFELAQDISALTDGAFDVTVGPLIAAWGFGAAATERRSPSASELAALRSRVGYQLLRLDPTAGQISKARPEVVCDLSAIAKGYAVDQAAEAMRDLGYRDFLIEVGGELVGHGRRPDGNAWRVAIERPDALSRGVYAVVALDDAAMATSGDYRNFHESDGVRLSHLVDPRVGRPIAHRLASVTVVDESAARADALATALSVLGPEEGHALAEREGVAAYFILRSRDNWTEVLTTPAFDGLLIAEPGRPQPRATPPSAPNDGS
jgi:thiamine biosynthesis lipoprotein